MKKSIQKLFLFCSLFVGITAVAQPTWVPEICLVTVDSATASYNTVMWNKPNATDIDSFYIFRSDTTPWTTWTKIAVVDFADSSVYDDIAVNVNNQWYKYKISAVDFSGAEGPKSLAVNSCWLDVVPNVGAGYFTCQWNIYDNPYNTALNQRCIWDSVGSGNLNTQVGGLMPSTWISWNHTGYSLAASSQYRLEVFVSANCTPSRAIVNTSRSNIKGVANPSLLIHSKEEAEKLVKVYPNPANGMINLEWNAAMGIQKMEVCGLRGEIIYTYQPGNDELKKSIQLNNLSDGVYFVRFHSVKGVISKKFTVLQ